MAKKEEKPAGGAGGGSNGSPIKPTFKVTKLLINPARKIGLENYSSVTLNAGVEITFDEPQDINSDVVTDAFAQVRARLQKEFRAQKDAFGQKKK